MEKVIVVNNYTKLRQENVKEVNELLQEGWTVKFIRTEAGNTQDNADITAIFVLEKK